MKKGIKITLITAAVLAVLGALLIIASVALGVDFDRLRSEGMEYVVGDMSVNLGSGGINIGGNTKSDGEFSPDGRYVLDADGIDSIKLIWISGEAEIDVYAGSSIVLTETSARKITENNALVYTVRDGVLTVTYCPNGAVNVPSKNLTVSIPTQLASKLRNLSVESVSADVEVEGFTLSDRFEFDSTSGSLDADDITADTAELGTVSGRIDWSGEAKELSASTTSGNVELDVERLGKVIEVGTVSGDVRLELPQGAGFTLDYDTVSGDLTSKIPMTSDGVCGDGKCTVDVGTVSGSLRLEYED